MHWKVPRWDYLELAIVDETVAHQPEQQQSVLPTTRSMAHSKVLTR